MNNKDLEQIERSILKENTMQEEEIVRARLLNEPDFAFDYDLHKRLIAQVRLDKRNELKKMFDGFEKELPPEKSQREIIIISEKLLIKRELSYNRVINYRTEIIKMLKTKLKKWHLASAAVIFLVIGALLFWNYLSNRTHDGLTSLSLYKDDSGLGLGKNGNSEESLITIFSQSDTDAGRYGTIERKNKTKRTF